MKRLGLSLSMIMIVCLVFVISCVNPALKHVSQGNTYFEQEQWDQAIVEYETALEIDSTLQLNDKLVKVYIERANAYNKGGEYDRAISDFEKALGLDKGINIDSKLAEVYVEQAKADSKNKDYDKAIIDLTKAMGLDGTLNLNSELAEAYYSRGCTHLVISVELNSNLEKSEWDLVIADLSKAIELNPSIDDKLILAAAYFFDEQYSKVMTYCTEAIKHNPEKAVGYYWLGRAYGMQCLYTKSGCSQAIDNYNKAIELASTDSTFPNPYHAEAYALRATLQYISPVTGNITDCNAFLRDLNKALEIDPNNLGVHQLKDSVEGVCHWYGK